MKLGKAVMLQKTMQAAKREIHASPPSPPGGHLKEFLNSICRPLSVVAIQISAQIVQDVQKSR